MALITISETARLTGKNRTTIYKYINSGKLSVVASVDGSKKIDTSEILRVFPDCKIVEKQQHGDNVTQQHTTQEVDTLRQEISHLKELMKAQQELLAEKDKRNEDLKQALLLIESKLPSTPETAMPQVVKKSWQFWKK